MRKKRNVQGRTSVRKKSPALILMVTTVAVFGVLFVFIRMKSVEADYQYNSLAKKIEKQTTLNKDLKGVRARILSVNRLNKIAKKYQLKVPDENHIIVVPNKK